MGSSQSTQPAQQQQPPPGPGTQQQDNNKKPQKKICCACPETKKLRDMCIMEKGEENCKKEIEDHKVCLRKEGFNV